MVAPSILFEWKQLFLINCSVMKAFKCSFSIYLAFSMSIRCSERTIQPEKKILVWISGLKIREMLCTAGFCSYDISRCRRDFLNWVSLRGGGKKPTPIWLFSSSAMS